MWLGMWMSMGPKNGALDGGQYPSMGRGTFGRTYLHMNGVLSHGYSYISFHKLAT